jgi:hypothetical protein
MSDPMDLICPRCNRTHRECEASSPPFTLATAAPSPEPATGGREHVEAVLRGLETLWEQDTAGGAVYETTRAAGRLIRTLADRTPRAEPGAGPERDALVEAAAGDAWRRWCRAWTLAQNPALTWDQLSEAARGHFRKEVAAVVDAVLAALASAPSSPEGTASLLSWRRLAHDAWDLISARDLERTDPAFAEWEARFKAATWSAAPPSDAVEAPQPAGAEPDEWGETGLVAGLKGLARHEREQGRATRARMLESAASALASRPAPAPAVEAARERVVKLFEREVSAGTFTAWDNTMRPFLEALDAYKRALLTETREGQT